MFLSRKLFLSLSKMQLGIGTFWSGIKIDEIDALWDT